METADRPVLILGAGAIGGYVGSMLSAAGEPVVLVDGWPPHVEAVRERGFRIEGPDGVHEARPEILHLGEIQGLKPRPRLAVLSVKLYDTEWAAAMIRPLLGPGAAVLTLQNALVEETVARIVGWSRVLGGIATGMNVELAGPGLIRRGSARFGAEPVFKIGEMHGRATPRARAIADLFAKVDTAKVTTDLWNDRWLKLTINATVSAIGGIADLSLDAVHRVPEAQRVGLRLAAEACAVGAAMGFDPAPLFGLPAERWMAAQRGDAVAAAETRAAYEAQGDKVVQGYRSGTLQDLARGRRTEAEFFNGYIAERGAECGVPAPTHAAVAAMMREIEAGRRAPGRANLAELVSP